MSDKRPAKKTESVEVRLPFETKRALIEKCKKQGVTVSSVIRALIDQYLQPRPYASETTRSNYMSMIASRPRAAFVVVASALGLAVLSLTPLRAEDVLLSVNGSITETDGAATNRSDFDTSLVLDFAAPETVRFIAENGEPTFLQFSVTQAKDEGVLIAITIYRKKGREKIIIGSPVMLVNFDEPAGIEVAYEDGAEEVASPARYELNLIASRR